MRNLFLYSNDYCIKPIFIIIISISITIIWWIFFREKIGYITPSLLIKKYKRISFKIILLWTIRLSIIICLAGIITNYGVYKSGEFLRKEQHKILIILDISRSMLAEDILPSRMQAAKETINTFIKERKDDLFGMIVFAGRPIVSVPFSRDTSGISNIVSGITPYSIRQDLPGLSGTAIGDAILLANNTLSGVTENSSIILITDGRANIGIDPVVAAIESQLKGIPIFSIAIGGTSDSILSYTDPYTQKRVTLLDEDGEPLKSDIDEELLKNISKITGGAYFRASAGRELYRYWDSISEKIGKKETKVTEIRFVSYRPHILLLLILLLICERITTSMIFYKNHTK